MKDKPRIGCGDNYDRIWIFNANYSATGERVGDFERPWNLYTPNHTGTYATQPEALERALQEAGKQ